MNKVKCPYCDKQIELSEALSHELRENLLAESASQHEKDLEEARRKAAQEASEQLNLMIKTLKDEVSENKERNTKLQEDLVGLMKQLRQAQQEKDDARLDAEKRIAQEQEKIRQDTLQKAEEQHSMKDREKDLKIDGLMKALEDAQRKAQQGSQQAQGEALELELEQHLRSEFPNDKIEEVKKGQRGGDLTQEVWDRNGIMCGTILWEFKNTTNWTDSWIDKLKQDQRSIHAETAVIISEVLPKDIKTAGYRNGVWITTRRFALVLAMGLRANLIQVCQIKKSAEGKNEKMEVLYKYLSGTEFTHRMDALAEAFNNIQDEIEKEKRYFSLKWSRDEKNIRMLIDNTFGIRGELESIMKNSLTSGAVLKLSEGETSLES
jgi:hypothetical protein